MSEDVGAVREAVASLSVTDRVAAETLFGLAELLAYAREKALAVALSRADETEYCVFYNARGTQQVRDYKTPDDFYDGGEKGRLAASQSKDLLSDWVA